MQALLDGLKFDPNGLIPVIVQDVENGQVLVMAYTNRAALEKTIETGKVAGTDLREGTPTLPLLLAAREDAAVREALSGGPIEGALLRVAATGALERSREVALDYAREARESLNGGLHREELESLADAVVNRKR